LSLHDERLVTYHAEASGQAFAKSGSTADTAAGGPLDGVMVTILNADKRIARMCSRRWRNEGLRWTAVTIDNPERRQRRARPYHHPTGCTRSHRADRNARSSIIVSDEPLSRERSETSSFLRPSKAARRSVTMPVAFKLLHVTRQQPDEREDSKTACFRGLLLQLSTAFGTARVTTVTLNY
jgi:hypothetical protein